MENISLQFKKIKKKKNTILMVNFFSFSFFVGVGFVLYFGFKVSFDILLSLYLFLSIAYLFLIAYFRSKLVYLTMNYNYYKMLLDDMKPIKLNNRIYTKNWINKIETQGFILDKDEESFSLYYKFDKKLSNYGRTGHALTAIIIAKNESFDFYDNKIDKHVEALYEKYPKERQVKKQIILQFKMYEAYKEEYKEKADEIINFKNGVHYFINISIAYFKDDNTIYFLRPKKRFPHKYYHYATSLIFQLCGIYIGDEYEGSK